MKRLAPILIFTFAAFAISAFKITQSSPDHTVQNLVQPQSSMQIWDNNSHKISQKDLLGCWTNSREENNLRSPVKIYRPCSYHTFPPLRFRFRMELKKDFKCSFLHQAPSDAHPMKDGKWSFNQETKILKIFDANNEEVIKFKVEAVGKKMLKLRV